MRLEFSRQAFADLEYWVATDPRTARKIIRLIGEITRTPFTGTGKPERLKHDLAGWWSRRIDRKHRIVYRVEDDCIILAQARNHYGP